MICTGNFSITVAPSLVAKAWWPMQETGAGSRLDGVGALPLAPAFIGTGSAVAAGAGKIGNGLRMSGARLSPDITSVVFIAGPDVRIAWNGVSVSICGWFQNVDVTNAAWQLFTYFFPDGSELRLLYGDVQTAPFIQLSLLPISDPNSDILMPFVWSGGFHFFHAYFNTATGLVGLQVDNGAFQTDTSIALPPAGDGQLGVNVGTDSAFSDTSYDVLTDELAVFSPQLTGVEATSIYNGGSGRTCCPIN